MKNCVLCVGIYHIYFNKGPLLFSLSDVLHKEGLTFSCLCDKLCVRTIRHISGQNCKRWVRLTFSLRRRLRLTSQENKAGPRPSESNPRASRRPSAPLGRWQNMLNATDRMLSSQVRYAKFISQDVQRACLSTATAAKNNCDYAATEQNPLPPIREKFLPTPFTVLLSGITANSHLPSDAPGLNSAVRPGWFGWKLTVVCGDHEGVGGRVSRRSAVFEGAVRLALLKLPVQTKQVHSWRRGGGKQDEGRRRPG